MAHNSLEPAGGDRYYEGNTLEIRTITMDSNFDNPIDLTDATVEFYLKEDRTDSDSDALLDKSSDNTGEAEITDPENGEASVYIAKGDTDGVLTDGTDRLESKEFFWKFDVIDTNNNLVTTMEGTWEIWSA